MTAKDLFDAIGLVDDELVLAADAAVRRRPAALWRWVPLAACLCLAVGVWQSQGRLFTGGDSFAASSAETATDFSAAEAAPEAASEGSASLQAELLQGDSTAKDSAAGAGSADAGAAQACPLDASGFDAWQELDAARLAGEPVELSAGVLYVLTNDGGPFTVEAQQDILWTLSVQPEAPDAAVTVGYAPAGGAPTPGEQDAESALTATLGENPAGEYYFYLIPGSDVRVSLQLGTAVGCRVAPVE